MKELQAFIAKYMSPTDFADLNAAYGFSAAATWLQVLKQCGNDLSRDNIMRQAANLKDLELPLLLPGIKVNTSPDKLQADPPVAARDIQWRELGVDRGRAERLRATRSHAPLAQLSAELILVRPTQPQQSSGRNSMITRRVPVAIGCGRRRIFRRRLSGRAGRERPGRHRHGNQDRADNTLQWSRIRLWRDRSHRGGLFQDDQRAGRGERPQDQLHQPRRRL